MPDPETLTFMAPHNIDGDPDEVAREAAETLRALLAEVEQYAVATERQVRNAATTELFKVAENVTQESAQAAWEEHPLAARCARVVGAIGTARTLAEALVEDVK